MPYLSRPDGDTRLTSVLGPPLLIGDEKMIDFD
jgi:hypothetical protein